MHQVRIGWWMNYTQNIYGLATLGHYFSFCMMEASKVEHSASYVRSRLLVAAGGSLRFGCQHPATQHIRCRGHPFAIAAINRKYSFEVHVKRERDSKTFG